jgi:hypothetical protein
MRLFDKYLRLVSLYMIFINYSIIPSLKISYICKCPIYLNFQKYFAQDLIIITGTGISQQPLIAQTCAYMKHERGDILSLPM